MYENGGIAAGAAGLGTLAATGFEMVWLALAAMALVAAGAALWRIVPRLER
jgi:hypothetical protein